MSLKKSIDEFIRYPKKALFKVAGPFVIGMLIQTFYNIADTIFVGRIGPEAIAALTFAFPFFFILISLNVGLSAGMNSRISRFLGQKKFKEAENTAMHAIIIASFLGVFTFIVGNLFVKDIMKLFGASQIVYQYSVEYLGIIFTGALLMFPAMIMSHIFSSQGDTKTSTIITASSMILNIILDPIFIYVLGYGVKGAAIATAISFSVGFFLAIFLLKTRSKLKIHVNNFKFSKELIKDIFKIGIPASLMMLTMSIFFMIVNKFASAFGTEHVAALGVAFRFNSVVTMPLIAISIALLTLVGMFAGARRYDLVKFIVMYAIKIDFVIVFVLGFLLFLFPETFLKIFTSDKIVLDIGSEFLRIMVFSYPFMAISVTINRALQGMGYGVPGLIINLLRTLLIAVPVCFVFINIFNLGFISIPISIIIGGVIASIVAIILFNHKLDIYIKN